FGSTAAASFTVVSDTQITATAPSQAAVGTVDVTVTGAFGDVSALTPADQFTYVTAAFRTNVGFSTNVASLSNNGTASGVGLGFTVTFYGPPYSSAFINENGNLTFDAPLANGTPFPLTTTIRSILAPFFADVDTSVSPLVSYGTDT